MSAKFGQKLKCSVYNKSQAVLLARPIMTQYECYVSVGGKYMHWP